MAGHRLSTVITILAVVMLLPVYTGAVATLNEDGGRPREGPPAPELLSPANDSWVTELPMVLSWNYSYNGLQINEVSFAIQIDNNPDFESPEVYTGLGSDIFSFSPTSELSMSGTYFWHVMAKNITSNETSSSETRAFNLDLGSPDIQSAFIDGIHGYTSDRNITVTIRARDFSGVDSMRYSFDKSNWTDWVPYAEKLAVILGPVDGKWTVYVQVRDRFGKWAQSSPMRIILDTLVPIGNITINNGTMYATSPWVLLDLPANDTNGIRDMMIANYPYFNGTGWLKYNPKFNWTLPPGDGWKTVYAKFRDPAGWESAVASASIMLDTFWPYAAFAINSGAAYTNTTNVTLQMSAGNPDDIDSLVLSDSESLAGSAWQPFAPSINHVLLPGDGPKNIHIKVRDSAGNEGPVVNASILLDTTPPFTIIGTLNTISENLSFPVSWSGADGGSGVDHFDVEYREELGPWTVWLNRTTATRAVFTGKDGSSYSFRVRAKDRAGNIEPFAEQVDNEVRIQLPLPTVDIQWPLAGATLQGVFTATGSASHPMPGIGIDRIDVRIDNGSWSPANGTSSWSYQLDPTELESGRHSLDVRSYDGTKYSPTASRLFYVEDRTPGASAENKYPYPIWRWHWSSFLSLV